MNKEKKIMPKPSKELLKAFNDLEKLINKHYPNKDKWMSGLPTENGYYWVGVVNHADLSLVKIHQDYNNIRRVMSFASSQYVQLEAYDNPSYRWYGPLFPPPRPMESIP